MNKFLINLFGVVPVIIAIVLWLAVSLKCGLLFYGMFTFGMYFHITTTTLSNAFIGRKIDVVGDLFWKMIFLIVSCLCLTLFFIL